MAVGLIAGIGGYFAWFGKFRRGSSLLLHLALGWFIGFLLLPVLFDVRMTPPRGDNWAGMLGLFGGLVLYCVRCRQWPLLAASLVAGTIGGIGFSGGACVEALLESFGNANLAPGFAQAWTNWQNSGTDIPVSIVMLAAQPIHHWEFWLSANWHSFLEQTYGFVNGLAVIAAMAVLWRRLERSDDSGPREYWTEVVAISIVVPVLMWVTLQKDVAEWTQGPTAAMPATMRMPLFGYSLSAWGWFNVIFGIAAMAFVMLLNVHTRRRLALLEVGWLGRGQWLYLLVLWAFVIGNFGRIVVHFTEQRLLSEGVITLNAVLATMLVLLIPRTTAPAPDTHSARLSATGRPRRDRGRGLRGRLPRRRNPQRASRLWGRTRHATARRRARPDHAVRPARRLETSPALKGQRPPLTALAGQRLR